MSRPHSTAASDLVTIAGFLVMLLLPALQFAVGDWRGDTGDERRAPAPFPKFEDPTRFAERFEAYFDDRFGFRRSLIRIWNAVDVEIFDSSPVERVMVGKDGWLYLNLHSEEPDASGLMQHYHGVKRFSPPQLRSWLRAALHQHEQAARLGAHYLFLVAPDKHTIYPEHLPDRLRLRSSTALDQLSTALAGSRVAAIDLRPPLRKAKAQGKVYWRGGTHWTDLGAKVVDDEIVRALGRWFPELAPSPLESQRISSQDGPGRGLARMLHLQDHYRELHPRLEGPRPARAVESSPAAMVQSLAEFPALVDLYERAPWVAFETGNPVLPRAVIVVDSFGGALMPYLAEHFARSVFLTRIIPPAQRLALIELEHPDVIIDEIVERNVRGHGKALAGSEFERGRN